MPRTLAVAEALSAQQNLDQAMEAASTAAMGFKAGWIPGFPTWWRFRVHQEWYIDMPVFFEGGRGWEGGMLWKWNCWCLCFVPFINAGYFFPAQWGCISNTKESWSSSMSLFVYLSLVRAFWANQSYLLYLSIDPSILSIYPARSIYIHLSVHVSMYRMYPRDTPNVW